MPKSEEALKQEILTAQKNADIASLYVLEEKAHTVFSEDDMQGFYANILDLVLENLTNALESHRKMDMQEVQDFATVRALYEYAMEHYSAGATKDASALFEVLCGLTNDDIFSSALKLHWIATSENISLDNFISKIADIELTQSKGTFYISSFTKEAQLLLDNAQIEAE